MVGAQPTQGRFDRAPHVGATAFGPGGGPEAHVDVLGAELRGEHDLVAATPEHLAEELLGRAIGEP